MAVSLASLVARVKTLRDDLARFPWRTTAWTLRERFREDRLGLTASSLTFTTLLALVPLITVALAVFTAFPMFGKLQYGLQKWLIDSLVPDSIARQVLGYLTQFAAKASRLGVVGLSFLLVTALALILTIDRTLNAIWRVRHPRKLGQRVLIYWAAMTFGPLALGLSLGLTSYLLSASRGLVEQVPGGVRFVLDVFEFCVLAAGMAGLYRFVPNTPVAWGHAWAGGLFVAVGLELAKRGLGAYLASVPTYSKVYGAFATVPILLVWVYVVWVIVLLGAVVAAYMPSLLMGVARRADGMGWGFQLAVEVLQQLHQVRPQPAKGLGTEALAQRLRVDVLQLAPVLEVLCDLDWVGRMDETAGSANPQAAPRYVLLADPHSTVLEPLVTRLLLARSDSLRPWWQQAGVAQWQLADVLTEKQDQAE